jgi:1,2-dihydroxy-3-keto-5-methylthiopentene dioxygenase
MAVVRIPEKGQTFTAKQDITRCLAAAGIEYETWEPEHPTHSGSSNEEVLDAYSREVESLKVRGGYVTADVINITQATPGLDALLAKFNREHWHDEDEVRFILDGHGLFHVRPRDGAVLAIQVEAGDLIRVPRGTWHWFDLCADRKIRAIRLFQDPAGWTPQYTDSGSETGFQPLCLGLRSSPES